MFWEVLLDNLDANILIFARMLGLFIFNPIFSRRNIPTTVRIGASLILSVFMISHVIGQQSVPEYNTVGQFAVAIVIEGFIGFVMGFTTQMFISMLQFSGEIMDNQSGLGMAKVYDPASGVQMSIYGSILNYLFVLYFFATNAHLAYIKLFALSYSVIPVGAESISIDIASTIIQYFGVILELMLKLSMPIIAAQLMLELCVGILMKAVPQIQVMVINIQLKLIFGLILIMMIISPVSEFIEKLIWTMVEALEDMLPIIAAHQ